MKSKAVFLLLIFLLNTLVGFGCALGMQEDHDSEAHLHPAVHDHKNDHHHQHDAKPHEHQEEACCKVLVNDLVVQSKLIPAQGKVQLAMPVILLPDFAGVLSAPVIDTEPDQVSYASRRERPPNEDIRISIQSFQL